MIKLTRLRQNTPFILNPDHIERIDTHVDTVVRLTTGAEYVVNETGEDIVRMTIEYRAHVLAAAGRTAIAPPDPDDDVPPSPAPAAAQEPRLEPEPELEPEQAPDGTPEPAAVTVAAEEVAS